MSDSSNGSAAEDTNMDPICSGLDGIYSPGIHVVGIFVVLAASFIGAVLPVLGKRVSALRVPEYVFILGKCLGMGVMLSVGLIHMMGDAASNFTVTCVPEWFQNAYSAWTFLFAGVAIVLMHTLDIVIGGIVHGWYLKREEEARSLRDPEDPNVHRKKEFIEPHDEDIASALSLSSEESISKDEMVVGKVSCEDHGCGGHHHGVEMPSSMSNAQRVVAAVCMEFGVTLHSIFVGLDLGVTPNNETIVLMVALLFHQMFEGIALGSRIVDADFKLSMDIVFMFVFSLAAPIGVAVGTGAIMSSPTALSGSTYVMVSSIMDSLCGGILVYLALSLMLIDFPKDMRRVCNVGSYSMLKKIGMFSCVWIGTAVMMVIGKWC